MLGHAYHVLRTGEKRDFFSALIKPTDNYNEVDGTLPICEWHARIRITFNFIDLISYRKAFK